MADTKKTSTRKSKAGARKKGKKGKSKMTKFRVWCLKNGIAQITMNQDTYLSLGSINNMWHVGKSNDSTILLVSLVYELDFEELKTMITTFED